MPRRRAKVLSETKLAERRAKVAALYLEGQPQAEIARRLKVNQSTISRDLAVCRQEWRAGMLRDFDERQAEELAKLDRLEAEAWAAWQRSTRPAQTTTDEKVTTDDPDQADDEPPPPTRSKAVKRIEERDGNPAFLAVVERCIAARREILGLDAPKRVDADLRLPDLRAIPDGDLARLQHVLSEVLDTPPALPPAAGGGGGPGAAG
jgi:hypothetical protein